MGLRDVQSKLMVQGQHLVQFLKSQDRTTYSPECVVGEKELKMCWVRFTDEWANEFQD
jgi:hypothetical protein